MSLPLTTLPGPGDLPDYYLGYLARVEDVEEVLPALRIQGAEVMGRLGVLPVERQLHRYAPGKWTVREVLGHVMDTERVFQFRALSFARGDAHPLPGFDENAWAERSTVGELPLERILEEYSGVRNGTVLLFRNLGAEALERRGVANGQTFQVGALAWFLLAHEAHHMAILKERYGV